ncbi:MAG: helix-turn-helix transcriptional regulator [Chitinophagales bacterium]
MIITMNYPPKSDNDANAEIWLENLQALILLHASNNKLIIPDIVRELAMSKRTFERKLMTLTGKSPKQYVNELRLQLAHRLILSQKKLTVKEICFTVGFLKPEYFSAIFKQRYGYSPKALITVLKAKAEKAQIQGKNDTNGR